ncbi:phage tail tape measure protein [Gemella sp. zg-1178]|uniref:phage tail tape measure protein n=1 Tax=Gemella sp. zg-1178 TaxID=2840372 RepID=UPI001C04D004|nr:phage tail tape measure protein [Gemella sp. zg-1178]MBU0279214.1 phage tail tape measure protein [Gemella sp. zg-1178]
MGVNSVGGLSLPPLYTEIRLKYGAFKSDMDKVASLATAKALEIEKRFSKLDNLASRMVSFGKKASLAVTAPLVTSGLAVSKFAIDYEQAFAGVRKTTEATEAEYSKISDGIRKMAKEIPASAVSIAQVAEAAGQLGIKKEDILKFSRVMIDLGNATNLTATEAATSLARFSNVMGTSADNVDRLGSTIVALGNNTATTEREIVEMGLRLAGAGKQVGLTEAQTLGLAAALSSVGIEAEMGGSAMSKLLVNIKLATSKGGEQLQKFASVAGLSADEFKLAFERDASSALQLFLQGLNDTGKSGQSAIEILSDMGIEEVRLRDTILRAASASDKFNEAQKIANRGWKDNNALQQEAQQRYKTTASQLQIAKNKFIDLGISLGSKLLPILNKGLDLVGRFMGLFDKLPQGLQSSIGAFALLAAAIGPVSLALGVVVKGFIKARSAIGSFGTFAKNIFKKDLGQGTKTASTDFRQASSSIQADIQLLKKSLLELELQAKRANSSLARVGSGGFLAGANKASKGAKKGKNKGLNSPGLDTARFDVLTAKTKRLGDVSSDTSKKLKGLGSSSEKAGGLVLKAGSAVEKGGAGMAKSAKLLTKSSQALRAVGKGALFALPLIADVGFGFGGLATAATSAGAGLLGAGASLGSLALAAAPVVAGISAVALAGYGIYQAFTEQAVPAVDLYKKTSVDTFKSVGPLYGQHVESVKKVSEQTQEEYNHFFNISKEIRTVAEGMYTGLYQNSEEGHRLIVEGAERFRNDYVAKVNQAKDETLKRFNELFSSSSELSKEAKEAFIKDAEETATKTILSAEERTKRIIELSEELKTAQGENARSIKDEIIRLTKEQDEETVTIVAKNKAEQEVILSNLKDRANEITQEHVAGVIEKINKLRDDTIEAAKTKKDEQLRLAEEFKARKETLNGELTTDEKQTYEAMKKAAVETYAKATKEAERLRSEGISKLRGEYSQFDKSLDWNTGKVKSWIDRVIEGILGLNRTKIQDQSATYRINYQVYEQVMRLEDRGKAIANGHSSYMAYHYNGLDFVPYDGYHARLHRGERVLTAEENKEYSQGGRGDTVINIDKVYNNTPQDIRKIARELDYEMRKQKMALGGGL